MTDTVTLRVEADYAALVKCQRGSSARRPFLDIYPARGAPTTIGEGQEHFILALPVDSDLKIRTLSNAGPAQCRAAGGPQSALRRDHGYDEHVITQRFEVEDKGDGDWDDAYFTVELFRRLPERGHKDSAAPAAKG